MGWVLPATCVSSVLCHGDPSDQRTAEWKNETITGIPGKDKSQVLSFLGKNLPPVTLAICSAISLSAGGQSHAGRGQAVHFDLLGFIPSLTPNFLPFLIVFYLSRHTVFWHSVQGGTYTPEFSTNGYRCVFTTYISLICFPLGRTNTEDVPYFTGKHLRGSGGRLSALLNGVWPYRSCFF